ncbi:MAG: sensor histidine kinase [Candidatus Geothermincolia bacterium]
MKKKLSLRATLFIAILAVALVCVLASALLSSYLSHRQISQFVKEHESELVGTTPAGPGPDQAPPPPPQPPEPRGIPLAFALAGVLGVVLALVLGFLLAARLSRPLDGLTAATGKISAGDYKERVDIRGASEVEELGAAFNSLAESLERNEELRQHMVADIAHELRNPLATLRGQLELMQDGKIECSRETVDSLMEDAVLLSRIVDDLGQLSLVDAGKLEFVPQKVDARQMLQDARARFEHEAAGKDIELSISDGADLPPVEADPARLSQVLGNLVGNSIVHTPSGGSITLSAAREQGMVAFTVADTGAGIGPEELPHIFDRFYRADKSRTRATGGAGLGLSIAKGLVEAQGGRIWAESESGQGTSISFTVPVFHA